MPAAPAFRPLGWMAAAGRYRPTTPCCAMCSASSSSGRQPGRAGACHEGSALAGSAPGSGGPGLSRPAASRRSGREAASGPAFPRSARCSCPGEDSGEPSAERGAPGSGGAGRPTRPADSGVASAGEGAARSGEARCPGAAGGGPAWQQRELEVLRFQVGGLTLAVPLVLLGSIHPLEEQPAPLPGQADWCLGVLPGREPARRVVDTARVIMPERYHPGMRESYRYVLTVHESRWALAAEAITGTEVLAREQVRWRTRSGRRPWLAGTVIDHMCALIDVAGLDALLTTGAGQNSTDRGSKT